MTGMRNAWVALALSAFFLVLSVPAYRDMERLLIGLAAVSLLVALAIVGFTAAGARRPEAD